MQLFRRTRPAPAPPADVYPTAAPVPPRLLVCDDNDTVTQLLELLFTREGWAVDVVSTGEQCLALLQRVTPDVVLLDQQMDGLSGIETAKRMRKAGFDRPVLLFSAYLDAGARSAAARLGVVPVSKVDFPAVVRHVESARRAYLRAPSGSPLLP